MGKTQLLVDTSVTLALILAYVVLTVTHNDGNAVLGVLAGYLGHGASSAAIATARGVPDNGQGGA